MLGLMSCHFRNQKHLVIETMSYTNILRKERVTQFEEDLAEMLLKNAHANGIDNVLGAALQRMGDTFHRFVSSTFMYSQVRKSKPQLVGFLS